MTTIAFLQARLAATETLIIAYETAVTDLVAGTILSYTIDTGQDKQTVTKFSVNVLQSQLDSLYNRYDMLCTRITGGGGVIMRPAW